MGAWNKNPSNDGGIPSYWQVMHPQKLRWNLKINPSKNFPTDPCFAYPKPPFPTVYVSEFLSFGGVFGDVWGMRLSGYVGFPLEPLEKEKHRPTPPESNGVFSR